MRRRTAAALAGALVAASALGISSPAFAHNYVVSTTPEADSTITELPERFSVTTNAPLLDAFGDGSGFAIQIVDADGRYYGDGCVEVSGSTLSTAAALGEAGDYTLVWRIVSEDGHTVSDEFGFRWEPADDAEISTGSEAAPDCGGAATGDGEHPAGHPATAQPDADLGDVLWIGGAVLAVLAAGLITVLVLSRRRPE
ncbi:copper resistance protein CopC [Leifsonia sp. H3M29-4]|uniref:copper resistance CopC family protein n=1 Tax=Salinibacterium metalliresistens TaxID=3031321 RepID=UPI0023DA621C|nr:copper resistance CopC family protein [Salinibacterium metalliresistens]MDF1478650.1 copper resistance protein CopC [Salinibacterium metalliresistens]